MTEKVDCPKYEDCSAPLCPLQRYTIDRGIWYTDEDICIAKRFQTLPWVRKQKAIVKAHAASDRYYTVEMLNAVRQVRKGIQGIDPDQPLTEAEAAEQRWVLEKKGGRVVAKQNPDPRRVTRGRKVRPTPSSTASHQSPTLSVDQVTAREPKVGKLSVARNTDRPPSVPRKGSEEFVAPARTRS